MKPADVEVNAETAALRSFFDGHLTLFDASDAARLPVSAFLDLVERARATGLASSGAADGTGQPDISVVIPMFNEEGNIDALLAQLIPALETIGTYEIVFIDDCSRDRSREVVLAARRDNPAIRLVEFARNFGHQAALSAGIDHAAGGAVVLMDADLQDPPELLPELAAKWREGFEVVYAIREKRKEGLLLRASFFVFYRLLRRVSDVELPLDSGDFCLMDRKVVDALRRMPESNRFLRGLRGWVGFRQVGVPYERAVRLSGETKYSISARIRFAVDGLLSFSDLPLRLASFVGFMATVAAVIYLLVAVVAKVVIGNVPSGWTSIIFVTLVLGGVQLLMIGVIGEYLARTYQETKRRPVYLVRATHGTEVVPVPTDG